MMLAGLGLTYGTYLSAGSSVPHPTIVDLLRGEAVLVVYWLMFEAFDILELATGRTSRATAAIFPLNALAFFGITFIQWPEASPERAFYLLTGSGIAYLISATIRTRLRPPSSWVGGRLGTRARSVRQL